MSDASPRIVDRTERNAATSFRDNADGPPVEQQAVTGRPNDLVKDKVLNTTFADRAQARKASTKAVSGGEAEDKAVKAARSRKKG